MPYLQRISRKREEKNAKEIADNKQMKDNFMHAMPHAEIQRTNRQS